MQHGLQFSFFWRTLRTCSSVRHLVLWDDPGACKAGFLIINAQLSPRFSLWTCWLAVYMLQVTVVNQTTVAFWHIFSKHWASCLSFPHPTCLPSTELALGLSESSWWNVGIFSRYTSLLLWLSFSLSTSTIPPHIFLLCVLPLLASQLFTSPHPFLFWFLASHSRPVKTRNGRNVHWRVCSSSGLKDCGRVS